MKIRTRYAPSPTGNPHIGNLRTAVFAYLYAKHHDGDFLVRLEDTDQSRKVEGSTEYILHSLEWLGISIDEGVYLDGQGNVVEKGSCGPYTQSNRLDIYKEYAEKLLESGAAYRCFCSSERLDEMRKEQQAAGIPPHYDQCCRTLSSEESLKRSQKEAFVIRHAIPAGREVIFHDAIRGEITFKSDVLDDYVLMKSDSFPTYQLASVVDDHFMEISHVIRGEEWISSTPKNLLLYEAFGWLPPEFAHLPLILGSDKGKLSKRHGAVPILEYKEKGYLPEAVFNVMAFLGWNPGTEQEFFTPTELIERFSLERVQKGGAVFDLERLDYVNGWYIRHQTVEEVVVGMLPYLREAQLIKEVGEGEVKEYASANEISLPESLSNVYLPQVASLIQERLKYYGETVEVSWFFFKRPEVTTELLELLVPKKSTLPEVREHLSAVLPVLQGIVAWDQNQIEQVLREFIEEKGLKTGQVLWPIRAALTGEKFSPGAFEMLEILGKEESVVRIQSVIS